MKKDETKRAYPVIMRPDNGGYLVEVPDLNVATQGDSMADAIYMARDVIGVTGVSLEDIGKPIPEPNTTRYDIEDGCFVTYVDVDFVEYRRKNDNRKVKKNCTIPYYLSLQAEKEHINFSRVLTEALQIKLQMI